MCGDGICEEEEIEYCDSDCSGSVCGDGICEDNEWGGCAADGCHSLVCEDLDPSIEEYPNKLGDPYIKGQISADGKNIRNDYCVRSGTTINLMQYGCHQYSNEKYTYSASYNVCPNGCQDGACVSLTEGSSSVSNGSTEPTESNAASNGSTVTSTETTSTESIESTVTSNEEECNPNYYCKTEPSICPTSGIQIKVCEDVECGEPYYEEKIECTPGECSGCRFDNNCIPYGFRIETTFFENNSGNYKLYCGIEGSFKEQRIIDSQGNWASCQNDYECKSNICSSGECVELASIIKEASGFKSLVVKIVCKMGNLFNIEDYNQCIEDRL